MSNEEKSSRSRTALLAIGAVLLVAAVLRLAFPDLVYFNIHVARDCERTLAFFHGENFRTHGAELRFGGQTPGWLLYPLMAPPLLLMKDPVSLSLWIGLLATIGVWVTYLIGRDFLGGHRVGLLAALLAAVQIPIVLSLRYLWNPTFLPFLTPVMLYFLLQVCAARRPGFFPWLVLAWCTGASVHFSTHLLLIPAIVIFVFTRPRIPWHWLLAGIAIVGATFGPYVLRELRDRGEDVRQIVTSDQVKVQVEDVRPPAERWRFNFNMPIVAAHHVRIPVPEGPVAFRESTLTQDFSHFARMCDQLDEETTLPSLVRATAWASQIWVVLLILALVWGIAHLARRSGATPLWRPESVAARADAGLFAVLLWAVLPTMVLAFFNYYQSQSPDPGARSGLFSFRYLYILGPAQFLLLGWLLDRVFAWKPSAAWRGTLWGLLALYTLGCVWVMTAFFDVGRSTGSAFVHCGFPERHIYTLGVKRRLVDHLVDDLGLTPAGVERRLSGHWIFLEQWWLEDEIDYLLKIHSRIQENPPDDTAPLIRLYANQLAMRESPDQTEFEVRTGLREDEIEILSDEEFEAGIHILQYRFLDPGREPPRFNMANRWEYMPYR